MASSRELAEFSGLLADAVERSAPPDAALDLAVVQARSSAFRSALGRAAHAAREGASLPDALEREPRSFPADYTGLVRAGLAGGSLPGVLRQAQTYYSLQSKLRGQLGRIFLMLAGVLLVFVLSIGLYTVVWKSAIRQPGSPFKTQKRMLFVLPENDLQRALRWGFSHLEWVGAGIVLLGALGMGGLWFFSRWPMGARAIYWIPAWGPLQRNRDLALFTATLAMRLRTGATLASALESSSGAIPNRYARQQVGRLRKRIDEGDSLSSALFQVRFFPRTLAWAVSLAEARSDVPETLGTFARIYGANLEQSFEVVLQLVRPLGILVIANSVLLGVSLLMLPLYQTINLLSGFPGGGSALNVSPLLFLQAAASGVFFLALLFTYIFISRRRLRILILVEHLASLVRRGLPIQAGLRMLAGDFRGTLGLTLDRMAARIEDGRPLAEVFDSAPRAIPPFVRTLVAQGERGGNLARFLEEARRSYGRLADPRTVPVALMMYPLLLSIGISGVVFVLDRIIIAKIRETMTAVNMGIGNLPNPYGPAWDWLRLANNGVMLLGIALVLVMICGGFSLHFSVPVRSFRRWIDRILLSLPGIGRLIRDASLHRFSLTTGLLLRAGARLPDAVRSAARAEIHPVLREKYDTLAGAVGEGKRLSEAIREAGLAGREFVWLVETGEAGAALGDHLLQAADHYEGRLELASRRAWRSMIPCFVILNGGVVFAVCLLTWIPLRDLMMRLILW